MKTWVFADVHGHYDELMLALECAGYSDGDRLIGLGDYIDYASQSKQVIEFLCNAKRLNSSSVFVRGNHENQLIYSIKQNSEKSFYSWMDALLGRTTLSSYNAPPFDCDNVVDYINRVFPENHIQFLIDTVEFHDEGDYRFVHICEFKGRLITIHGHEHEHRPIISFHRINLAVEGGVAVLDLDAGLIHDNEGREFRVDKQRLYGKYNNSG
ncbi:MAG: metallophosphoesterase [Thermodesulfovibrionales bacterium]